MPPEQPLGTHKARRSAVQMLSGYQQQCSSVSGTDWFGQAWWLHASPSAPAVPCGPGCSDRPFSSLCCQQTEDSYLGCSKHPLHTPQRGGWRGGGLHPGSGCTHADGWVSGVKPWEEAGALHQIPGLTRSDGAERVSDREGGRRGGSDGGAGGGERETGL